jgi:hypothetical protein
MRCVVQDNTEAVQLAGRSSRLPLSSFSYDVQGIVAPPVDPRNPVWVTPPPPPRLAAESEGGASGSKAAATVASAANKTADFYKT